jgi:small ligand-binding sensory domain FIST
MPFAAALSEHPVPAHAVGEVAGEILDRFGERPDLAFVFVTAPFAGALEDTVAAIDDILHPLVLLGVAAESIVGPHREVEQTAAISLFAARTGPLLPMALTATEDAGSGELVVGGWPDEIAFTAQALLLMADPFSFPADRFLAWVGRRYPGLPVVGGMASAAHAPGGNRLAIGRRLMTSGAVAVLLGPGVGVETVVSQGCRPFGQPVVVTRSDRNVILELAGAPALERLVSQAHGALTEEEVALLEMGGLQLGRVIDEHRESFGRGDFLLRSVLGADRTTGAIAVGDVMPVGTTVQFHLRDARTADEDLHVLLKGHEADGALVFTCNGRGSRLFDEPHHDVRVLTDLLGPVPLAGCFAAGEIGPVGGQNFVHGFTASMALLRDTPDSRR